MFLIARTGHNFIAQGIELDLLISKQSSKRPHFGQSSKQRKGLLACLLVYCLYIVDLVVAVVIVFRVNF